MINAVIYQLRWILYSLEGGQGTTNPKYVKYCVYCAALPLHTACRSRFYYAEGAAAAYLRVIQGANITQISFFIHVPLRGDALRAHMQSHARPRGPYGSAVDSFPQFISSFPRGIACQLIFENADYVSPFNGRIVRATYFYFAHFYASPHIPVPFSFFQCHKRSVQTGKSALFPNRTAWSFMQSRFFFVDYLFPCWIEGTTNANTIKIAFYCEKFHCKLRAAPASRRCAALPLHICVSYRGQT